MSWMKCRRFFRKLHFGELSWKNALTWIVGILLVYIFIKVGLYIGDKIASPIITIIQYFIDITKINFGNRMAGELVGVIVLVFSIIFLFLLIPYIKNRFRGVYWHILTLLLMGGFLFIGVVFIQNLIGVQDLNLLIYPDKDESLRLVCHHKPELDGMGWIVERDVECVLPSNFTIIDSEVIATLVNGSKPSLETVIISKESNSLTFQAPLETASIEIKMIVQDEKNTTRNLSASRQVRFLTEKEDLERRDRFVTYLIGLLAFIFIAIPQMMKAFHDYSLKRKE